MFEQETNSEEREQRTAVLIRFLDNAKNIQALHGSNLESAFNSESTIRDFVDNLQEDDFINLLNGVNGILRGKNKNEWRMDGDTVRLESAMLGVGHVPPRHEDKAALLGETLEAAKRMNTAKRSMEDIALLTTAAINDIHPYEDGNGRTARLIFALLTEGYGQQTKDKIKALTGDEGREEMGLDMVHLEVAIGRISINHEVKNLENNPFKISNLYYDQGGELEFHLDVDKKLKDVFIEAIKDHDSDMFLGVFRYIKTLPGYKKYTDQYPPGDNFERSALRVDRLTPDLTSADIQRIVDSYWNIKKEKTERIIDAIENPDNAEYQTEFDGARVSLLEYLKLRMRKATQS